MTALTIIAPYPFFTETSGLPLDDGYVYIGTANLDPRTNPITVYSDAALTVPVAQPLRTSGGYPMYQGSPIRLFTSTGQFSLRVERKTREFVYSEAAANGFMTYEAGRTLNGYLTRAEIKALPTFSGAWAVLLESGREGEFIWDATATIAAHQGDPGEGVYLAPNPAAVGAWVRKEALTGELWANWFGADASLADNSTAFQNINTYVASRKRVTPLSSNRAGGAVVHIGVGDFIIKTAGAFLNSTAFGARTEGIAFVGQGAKATAIRYVPSTAGAFINNNDYLLELKFTGITFYGYVADDASGSSDWMYSYNNSGGAQGMHVTDCSFSGTWRYGVNLQGLNNNSEHSYIRCNWYVGTWTAWQYSPASGGGGSDQFLNYWYLHCKYWSKSTWIDMASGGHIHITDSDVSGYEPTVDTYLFNLRTAVHASGVTNFEARGLRIEQKSIYAHVMFCEWEQGQVIFDGLDCSSQASLVASGYDHFHFKYSNTGGTNIAFRNSRLMGRAKYEAAINTWNADRRVTYDNCELLNWDRVTDYFTFTGGANPGGLPCVRGSNCKTKTITGLRIAPDFDLNWKTVGAATRVKTAHFGNPAGTGVSTVYNNLTIKLPIGSFIRKFINYAPAGHVGEAAIVTFTISSNGAPIATFTTPGFNSAGYANEAVVNFAVTSSAEEVITITTDATASSGSQVNAIEFI